MSKNVTCITKTVLTIKQMSEMNKAHFEQTLSTMQEQQADEVRAAVEGREKQYAQEKAQYTSEAGELRAEMEKLKIELNDEKAEKESVLARLAVSCLIYARRAGVAKHSTGEIGRSFYTPSSRDCQLSFIRQTARSTQRQGN